MRRPSCSTPRGGSRRSSPTWRSSARPGSSTCSSSRPPSTTCGSTRASGRGWPSSPPAPPALAGRLRRPRADSSPRPSASRLGLEQARANEAEIDAILTPSQRVRLRQIALQSEGPAAFREPEVVEALGLTPAQRERIRAIEAESLFGQIREMQSGKSLEDAVKPAMGASWPSSMRSRLDAGQELVGEPIRGPAERLPHPVPAAREPKRAPR